MMHDIGKVALAHGYPGLYPLIEEELKNQEWKVPMSHAEETYAGGANHCLVGRILSDSWKLGEDVSRVVENHHDPSAGQALESIVALADFIGGGVVPFPKAAEYPLVRVLAGTPAADVADDLEKFISPGTLEKMKLERADLIELAQFIAPSIRTLSASIKESL
jgi:HD-like signal output (HDOD) protein